MVMTADYKRIFGTDATDYFEIEKEPGNENRI